VYTLSFSACGKLVNCVEHLGPKPNDDVTGMHLGHPLLSISRLLPLVFGVQQAFGRLGHAVLSQNFL